MPFGDPWTAEQAALVDVVVSVWVDNGAWPQFHYVAAKLEEQGYDAAQVLTSFPEMGERSPYSRSYGDVFYDHTFPQPRDDSQVSLSVGGLSRHPSGLPYAEAFVAVAGLMAQRRKALPLDPLKLSELRVTDAEVVAALPEFPPATLRAMYALFWQEGLVGLQGSSRDPDTGDWSVTVGREATRYDGLTLESYVDLKRRETESTSPVMAQLRATLDNAVRVTSAIVGESDTPPTRRRWRSALRWMPAGLLAILSTWLLVRTGSRVQGAVTTVFTVVAALAAVVSLSRGKE